MGKSSINGAISHSYVSHNQRVYPMIYPMKCPVICPMIYPSHCYSYGWWYSQSFFDEKTLPTIPNQCLGKQERNCVLGYPILGDFGYWTSLSSLDFWDECIHSSWIPCRSIRPSDINSHFIRPFGGFIRLKPSDLLDFSIHIIYPIILLVIVDCILTISYTQMIFFLGLRIPKLPKIAGLWKNDHQLGDRSPYFISKVISSGFSPKLKAWLPTEKVRSCAAMIEPRRFQEEFNGGIYLSVYLSISLYIYLYLHLYIYIYSLSSIFHQQNIVNIGDADSKSFFDFAWAKRRYLAPC